MTPTQVRAAAILLNKVLPDLKTVEVDVHAQFDTTPYRRLSDKELMRIAAGGLSAIEGKCEKPRKIPAV